MVKTRVLMVCLGNICRSPLAEGVLKSKVNSNQVFVDSAGTGAYHIGHLPDKRSIAVAQTHDLDITDQQARVITKQDLTTFDYIYTMDSANYHNVLALATTDVEKAKVKMIMNELYPSEDIDVPDPYYGGDQGFEQVYQMLDKACDIIAKQLNS